MVYTPRLGLTFIARFCLDIQKENRNCAHIQKETQTELITNRKAARTYSRNMEARWCNRCYSGTAVLHSVCVCVFIAFVIRHAIPMDHTVTCGPLGSTIFFHIISPMGRFFWGMG